MLALSATRQRRPEEVAEPARHLVARLEVGEEVTLQLQPGVWYLHVASDPEDQGMCRRRSSQSPELQSSAEMTVVVTAGGQKRFTLTSDGQGAMSLASECRH